MSNLGDKKILSENLKYYIDARGIDIQQMAIAIGMPVSTVYSWVSGKFYPRIDKVGLLADYIGVDKMDLINKRGEGKLSQQDTQIAKALFSDIRKRDLAVQISTMTDKEIEKFVSICKIVKGE